MAQTDQTTRQRQENEQPSTPLFPISELTGYSIRAKDEELGRISDLLVDDRKWLIRYFVIDIGNWLTGRKVVLDSSTFGVPDRAERNVTVNLSRKKIEEGPTLAEHEPVSEKYRRSVSNFYGWPGYWNTGIGGVVPSAAPLASPDPEAVRGVADPEEAVREESPTGESLRSFNELKGYSVEATDDSIGHIEDMVTDPADWKVRYFVVDTRNWFPGKKVIIGIDWLTSVSFPVRSAYVNLKRDQIKNSPAYAPDEPITRDYEQDLHEHYRLPTYWV